MKHHIWICVSVTYSSLRTNNRIVVKAGPYIYTPTPFKFSLLNKKYSKKKKERKIKVI